MADDLIDTLEAFDDFAPLRNGLRRVAERDGEWAGIPMVIEERKLVIEPNYPHAAAFMAMSGPPEEESPQADDIEIRNVFWSTERRAEVAVLKMQDGKVRCIVQRQPHMRRLEHELASLDVSDVWGIEQESKAIYTLASMLRHRQFKQYLLTGMFCERSERSGVHYVFRKLRPTIALSTKTGKTKVLCTLCLHPIAYYEDSWCGAMCPTDDVIAHLALMRGDEAMFWRRANQHPHYRPEAGI